MKCLLCGTENPDGAQRCTLCDCAFGDVKLGEGGDAQHIQLEPVDASGFRLLWSRFALLLGIVFVIALPWYLISDLFVTPPEILQARDHYDSLRDSYLDQKDLWNQKKNQIVRSMLAQQRDTELGKAPVTFRDLPLEIFMAYLADDCDLLDSRFEDLVLFPVPEQDGARVILSKKEMGLWPFSINVSLEIQIYNEGDRLIAEIRRMRRGKRDVPPSLAGQYFAPELQALRRLEMFAGGIRSLEVFHRNVTDQETGPGFRVSWRYHHRPFLSER